MKPTTTSSATDFDFVIGNWHVAHRRLKARLAACTEWIEFTGTSETRQVLGGFGNIEDNLLDLPEGPYHALAIRSFDASKNAWAIWWLDGRSPWSIDTPVIGGFAGGVGTFYAEDLLESRPVRVRFTWTRLTSDDLRWEQAFSPDAGVTWETNWVMEFKRRRAAPQPLAESR
jgi:hypothetical protein